MTRKRMSHVDIEELNAKGRENNRRHRLKKETANQEATDEPVKASTSEENRETSTFNAQNEMNQEGIDKARANSRLHNARHRAKMSSNNMVIMLNNRTNLPLKPGDGYPLPHELVSYECKSLMNEDLYEFDMDEEFEKGQ